MARPTKFTICQIQGCSRPHMAKGWCGYHYNTARNHGDPLFLDARAGAVCQADECFKPAGRSGFCKPHYLKERRKQGLQVRRGSCSFEGCGAPHQAKGFCEDHYYRWKRYGDPAHPVRYRKGTGHVTPEGYRVFTINKRTVFEHRLVVERSLGRELLPEENVHHRNGDRLDNRLTNLELWSTSQPSGQRVSDKIAWAKEILATYEGLEGSCLLTLRDESHVVSSHPTSN